MSTATFKAVMLLLIALLVLGIITLLGMLPSNEVNAQSAPRACICSDATRVTPRPEGGYSAYIAHCACGTLTCALAFGEGGNQLACTK